MKKADFQQKKNAPSSFILYRWREAIPRPSLPLLTSLLLSMMLSFAQATPLQTWPQDDTQARLARDVVDIMSTKAFRKQKLDSAFSGQLLDHYLAALDPNRQIFFQSDITEFNLNRNQLKDELNSGKLSTTHAIYQRYRERYDARLQWAQEHVEALVKNSKFTGNEVVEVDRKKSPWPANASDADTLWTRYLQDAILSLQLADKPASDIASTLKRRFQTQQARLEKQTAMDNFEIFMNAYTELYDPHTNYLSPKTAKNFDIQMSLSLEGIGAVLSKDDEHTKVISLVPAGPAAKAGDLLAGDRIIAISQGKNGKEWEDIVGWRLDEAVELIRGEANTWVRLQVKRGDDHLRTIAIKREKVKLEDQAASKKIIDVAGSETDKLYKIGIITIPSFYLDFDAARRGDPDAKSTTRDVLRLLTELRTQNIDGIVLDLRGNGGGSLQEATQLTDLFIDKGPVVQILNTNNQVDRRNRAINPPFYKGPLLVLVNHFSASASEIFAGALQDYKRSLVVGEQTFGKGTVQTVIPLSEGKLKITEAKFYRVSGDSTQNRGVVPDISFPPSVPFKDVGESALENALPWDSIEPAPHYIYPEFASILPIVQKKHDERMKRSVEYTVSLLQNDFLEAQNNRKVFPLNREKRLAQKKQDENALLQLSNTVRAYKGEPPLKTVKALEDSLRKKRDDKNPADDFFLMESGKILADYIVQSDKAQRIANQKTTEQPLTAVTKP